MHQLFPYKTKETFHRSDTYLYIILRCILLLQLFNESFVQLLLHADVLVSSSPVEHAWKVGSWNARTPCTKEERKREKRRSELEKEIRTRKGWTISRRIGENAFREGARVGENLISLRGTGKRVDREQRLRSYLVRYRPPSASVSSSSFFSSRPLPFLSRLAFPGGGLTSTEGCMQRPIRSAAIKLEPLPGLLRIFPFLILLLCFLVWSFTKITSARTHHIYTHHILRFCVHSAISF